MIWNSINRLNLLSLCWLLSAPAVLAWQDTPEEGAGELEPAPGQEVEVSEDNYRRYMELKDQQIERAPLPVEAYESRRGLEKMDNLPEASQKHLRNELREIIAQGDAWEPEDAGTLYPFDPSADALTDSSLRQQEGEAWAELVGEYHAREAAIHAGAQARMDGDPTANPPTGQPGSSASRPGSTAGQPGSPATMSQATPGQPAMQQGNPQPSAPSQAAAQQQAADASDGKGEAQQETAEQAGEIQETPQEKAARATESPASAPRVPPSEVTEDGVTENALIYLKQKCEEDQEERPEIDCQVPSDQE